MEEAQKLGVREKFLQVYANVPLSARKEIIVVLDQGGPLTWETAYFEIKNNTERTKEILEKLERTIHLI